MKTLLKLLCSAVAAALLPMSLAFAQDIEELRATARLEGWPP